MTKLLVQKRIFWRSQRTGSSRKISGGCSWEIGLDTGTRKRKRREAGRKCICMKECICRTVPASFTSFKRMAKATILGSDEDT
ncbi:hypothetical protein Y032_0156g3124 [Ancylostoma ceylanicum]|uniref:Uncharacterized protein n=1 Tax=Ancylostoma ceylanicum TaxID=53326 RepID=A0A016SZ72_9BILA|nr:hypothetical protein Y032_0156g3124 [Ancylostoma ceylanicum]